MTGQIEDKQPGLAAYLLWLVLLAGLPALVAWHDGGHAPVITPRLMQARPTSPPPPVEPLELITLTPDQARAINASVPFSNLPNPPARPFRFAGSDAALARATDCLAAAMWYEAGDDPAGERAVGQVVLNRLRHPAFPKTVCGVVFQGAERSTGCQFTFTCDGALSRIPSGDAWQRARKLADKALSGSVDRRIGYATHYHTDWVVPYWSASLDKIAREGTHLFFRWEGWWGTPPAFRRIVDGDEPLIALIASLSPAHEELDLADTAKGDSLADLAAAPAEAIGTAQLGEIVHGARLLAVAPDGKAFLLALDERTQPASYPGLADGFCAGRPQCRIMAWVAPRVVPRAFPIDPALLPSMAFSYIHDSESGLRRALWNCALTPRSDKTECMRDRDPASQPPAIAIPKPLAIPSSAEPSAPKPKQTTPQPQPAS